MIKTELNHYPTQILVTASPYFCHLHKSRFCEKRVQMRNRSGGFVEIGLPLTPSPFACAMEALLLRLHVRHCGDVVEKKDLVVSDQAVNYQSK